MSTTEVEESASTSGRFAQLLAPLRAAAFGNQNERIEFLMDSYFKLTPEWRSAVIVGGAFGGFLVVALTISLYIAALGSLQSNLDQAFEATNQIKNLKNSYMVTKQKFNDLESKLEAANENLMLVSALETKAKELGLNASSFPPQLPITDLPGNNPLSTKYQSAKFEFRVSNASLKKIVEFVVAIENMPHMLHVTSLKIKGLYQNKLFFDAAIEVEGTVTKK